MSNPEWWALCRDDWIAVLAPYRNDIKRVLEVGSWEGWSAVFWHRFFSADVDCIDNWENTTLSREVAAKVEANFDANTKDASITKIKRDSTVALHALQKNGAGPYDLIYIDGDHHRDQVMIDSCLAWRLLRPGGIMIWDDWRDYCPSLPDQERPESAIRGFLMMEPEAKTFEDTGRQLFAQKTGRVNARGNCP